MLGQREQRVRPESDEHLVFAGRRAHDGRVGRQDVAGHERPAAVDHGATADVAGQKAHEIERASGRQLGGRGARRDGRHVRLAQYALVPLPKLAWLATVLVAVATGLILLLNAYTGYGILAFVVGCSAAINLR